MKRKGKKILASVFSVFLVLTVVFSSIGTVTVQAWEYTSDKTKFNVQVSLDNGHLKCNDYANLKKSVYRYCAFNAINILKTDRIYAFYQLFTDDESVQQFGMSSFVNGANYPNATYSFSKGKAFKMYSKLIVDLGLSIISICSGGIADTIQNTLRKKLGNSTIVVSEKLVKRCVEIAKDASNILLENINENKNIDDILINEIEDKLEESIRNKVLQESSEAFDKLIKSEVASKVTEYGIIPGIDIVYDVINIYNCDKNEAKLSYDPINDCAINRRVQDATYFAKQLYEKALEHYKYGDYIGAMFSLGCVSGIISNMCDPFYVTSDSQVWGQKDDQCHYDYVNEILTSNPLATNISEKYWLGEKDIRMVIKKIALDTFNRNALKYTPVDNIIYAVSYANKEKCLSCIFEAQKNSAALLYKFYQESILEKRTGSYFEVELSKNERVVKLNTYDQELSEIQKLSGVSLGAEQQLAYDLGFLEFKVKSRVRFALIESITAGFYDGKTGEAITVYKTHSKHPGTDKQYDDTVFPTTINDSYILLGRCLDKYYVHDTAFPDSVTNAIRVNEKFANAVFKIYATNEFGVTGCVFAQDVSNMGVKPWQTSSIRDDYYKYGVGEIEFPPYYKNYIVNQEAFWKSLASNHTEFQTDLNINESNPILGTSFSKSSNLNAPSFLDYNTGFGMRGTIYCTSNITSVTAGIRNSSGTVIRSATVSPNAKSYDLTKSAGSDSSLNSQLSFNGLAPGTYTYYVTATSGSQTATIKSATFTVKKPELKLTIDVANSPSGSYESGYVNCKIGGTVRSVYADVADCSEQELTKVLVQVKDSSGAVVLSKEYTSSGTKSISINNAVNINSLTVAKYAKQQYTYTVTATTKGGVTKQVLNSSFVIEDTTPAEVDPPTLSFYTSDPANGTQSNAKNEFITAVQGTLNVSWKAVTNGKYYTVYIYHWDDAKKEYIQIASKANLTGTSASFALPLDINDYDASFGEYSVRVNATNARKNKFSTGKLNGFTIQYPKPSAKLTAEITDAGSYSLFTVEGQYATKYIVKIYKVNKKGEELFSAPYNLTPEQNQFKVRLAEGSYRAEVYALNYRYGKDYVWESDDCRFYFRGEDVRFEVLRAQPEQVPLNVRYRNLDNGLSGVVQTGSEFKQAISGRVEFYWEPAIYAYSGYVVTIYKGNKVSDTVYRKLTSLSKNDLEVSAILPKGEYTAVLTAYNDSPKAQNVRYTMSKPITFKIVASSVDYLTVLTNKNLGFRDVYGLDEVLSKKGIVVMAHYENGESWPVTALCTFSTLDSSTPGTRIITVTYEGVSASFEVMVTDGLVDGKAYVSYDPKFLFTNKEPTEFVKNLTKLGLDKLYGLLYKDAFIYDSTAKTEIKVYKPTNAEKYTINIYRGSAINDYDDVLLNSSLVESKTNLFSVKEKTDIDGRKYIEEEFTGLPVGRYVAEVICSNGLTGSAEKTDKKYVNFNVLKNPWNENLATETVFLEYLDHQNGVTTEVMHESGGNFNQLTNGTVRINWTKMANYVCQVNIYQHTAKGDKLIISEISPNDYIDDMGLKLNSQGGIGILNYSAIVGYSEYALAPGSYSVVLKSYKKTAAGVEEYISTGKAIPVTTTAAKTGTPFEFEILPMDVEPNGLSIREMPAKLEYAYGEKIDLYGLKIDAVMVQTGEIVTLKTNDITVFGYDRYLTGEQTIELSYAGESVSITVTVDAPQAGKIYPTVYQVQEDGSVWAKDTTQFTAYAGKNIRVEWKPVENANSYTVYVYKGNKTEPDGQGLYTTIFNDKILNNGSDTTKRFFTDLHLYSGEYTVFVSANNENDGRYITFSQEPLHFTISGNDTIKFIYADYLRSRDFYIGEGFDLSNVIVTAYLENGDTMDITDSCEYLGFNTKTAGTREMVAVYNDQFSATLAYAVTDEQTDDVASGRSIFTSLSDNALVENNTVVYAAIDNTVQSISANQIHDCMNLVTLYIPESVTEIEDGVLANCPVTTIYCIYGSSAHTYAVDHNISFVIVSENASVTGSGKNADQLYSFDDYIDELYESLQEEEPEPCDPESVLIWYENTSLYIGESAEAYYEVLPYYSVTDTVTWSSSDNSIATVDTEGKVTAHSAGTVEIIAFVDGFEDVTESVTFTILPPIATVEDGNVFVPAYTFAGNTKVTSINLPLSVSAIGSYAFEGCSGLSGSITLHDGIEYIGAYAFAGCTGITEMHLPYGLEEIREGLFSGCTMLKKVYIPDSVLIIDPFVFDAFEDSITIVCDKDSYADYYAQACGLKTEYTEQTDEIESLTIETDSYAENDVSDKNTPEVLPTQVNLITEQTSEENQVQNMLGDLTNLNNTNSLFALLWLFIKKLLMLILSL